jgi:hypothetical protein
VTIAFTTAYNKANVQTSPSSGSGHKDVKYHRTGNKSDLYSPPSADWDKNVNFIPVAMVRARRRSDSLCDCDHAHDNHALVISPSLPREDISITQVCQILRRWRNHSWDNFQWHRKINEKTSWGWAIYLSEQPEKRIDSEFLSRRRTTIKREYANSSISHQQQTLQVISLWRVWSFRAIFRSVTTFDRRNLKGYN